MPHWTRSDIYQATSYTTETSDWGPLRVNVATSQAKIYTRSNNDTVLLLALRQICPPGADISMTTAGEIVLDPTPEVSLAVLLSGMNIVLEGPAGGFVYRWPIDNITLGGGFYTSSQFSYSGTITHSGNLTINSGTITNIGNLTINSGTITINNGTSVTNTIFADNNFMPVLRNFTNNNDTILGSLARTATHAENSMEALSDDEQKVFSVVDSKYGNVLKMRGSDKVLADLKDFLKARYMSNRPKVHGVELPFSWQELQDLKRHKGWSDNSTKYAEVLQAYYKNYFHSAYRYLSKPNPFMAANAGHVKELIEGGRVVGKYAYFEAHLPTILLFWTAVKDPNELPINEISLQARCDLFAAQLAGIGRAHNWDNSRLVACTTDEYEQYDDLTGDKPSCYGGVKKRLYQVLGHRLFVIVTKEAILNELLREYYREVLGQMARQSLIELKQAVDDQEIFADADFVTKYPQLQLTNEVQDGIAEKIKTRRNDASDYVYKKFVHDALNYKLQDSLGSHFIKAFVVCDLGRILQDTPSRSPVSALRAIQ